MKESALIWKRKKKKKDKKKGLLFDPAQTLDLFMRSFTGRVYPVEWICARMESTGFFLISTSNHLWLSAVEKRQASRATADTRVFRESAANEELTGATQAPAVSLLNIHTPIFHFGSSLSFPFVVLP